MAENAANARAARDRAHSERLSTSGRELLRRYVSDTRGRSGGAMTRADLGRAYAPRWVEPVDAALPRGARPRHAGPVGRPRIVRRSSAASGRPAFGWLARRAGGGALTPPMPTRSAPPTRSASPRAGQAGRTGSTPAAGPRQRRRPGGQRGSLTNTLPVGASGSQGSLAATGFHFNNGMMCIRPPPRHPQRHQRPGVRPLAKIGARSVRDPRAALSHRRAGGKIMPSPLSASCPCGSVRDGSRRGSRTPRDRCLRAADQGRPSARRRTRRVGCTGHDVEVGDRRALPRPVRDPGAVERTGGPACSGMGPPNTHWSGGGRRRGA